MGVLRALFSLFLLGHCLLALAQQEMEIIPLRHRGVEQVLPALQPLVEPGGVLSGMNNQLIVRASRRNRDEIRQALAAIDTPLRRLLIRVSQSRDTASRQGGAQIETRRGEVNAPNARVYDTRSLREARGSQTVQVVEGGRAFIQIGQSLPLPMRQVVLTSRGALLAESVVYRDIGQGFYAEPRLAGDRVTLEISPRNDTPGALPGSVDTQRLSTTVSGRLGEWIELGGSGQSTANRERGVLGTTSGASRDARSVWLLVEEIP